MTLTMRLVIAWFATIGALVACAWFSQSPAGNDWVIRGLMLGGIPYLILITRWVVKG